MSDEKELGTTPTPFKYMVIQYYKNYQKSLIIRFSYPLFTPHSSLLISLLTFVFVDTRIFKYLTCVLSLYLCGYMFIVNLTTLKLLTLHTIQ